MGIYILIGFLPIIALLLIFEILVVWLILKYLIGSKHKRIEYDWILTFIVLWFTYGVYFDKFWSNSVEKVVKSMESFYDGGIMALIFKSFFYGAINAVYLILILLAIGVLRKFIFIDDKGNIKMFSKKTILLLLTIVVLAAYTWVRYFKIDYSETTWLTVQGYKSKGYVPYLKATYAAGGEACQEFVFGLGSSLARNEKQLFFAKVSEDDLHYTIRYPMNYKQGACEFWFGRGFVHIEERNELDEKRYPRTKAIRITQIYDSTVGMYDIKYFEPSKTYSLSDKNANPLQVNQYCQRSLDFSNEIYRDKDNKRQTKHYQYKRLICHPEGFYGKKPFFSFKPFVLKHPDFMYNIVVSEDVKGRYATEKQLKANGLQAFVKGFSPSAQVFQTFKQKHNIKEP